MDDPTPLGRLELIERDETGNITAVITEGPGGGKINVVVSFRSRISVEKAHHASFRNRNCIEALAADGKGRYQKIKRLTLRGLSVYFYRQASRQA